MSLRYSPSVARLTPYAPGLSAQDVASEFGISPSEVVKLGSGENPFGPSPAAVRAISEVLGSLNRYPDWTSAELGRSKGMQDLIAFDMGGTTAKVGVIQDGRPRLAREFYADRYVGGDDLGGYAIRSPVIDLAEIGAGGGSIAWLDPAGVLKVGPQSAGSQPGPACYGRGGGSPTVTDAHCALGTLPSDSSEGETPSLRPDLARAAIEAQIARPLGWTVERSAHAILEIATANMAEMVRLVTVRRRGLDPRDFALVAYGGAGSLRSRSTGRYDGGDEEHRDAGLVFATFNVIRRSILRSLPGVEKKKM